MDYSFMGGTNAAGNWAATPNFLQLLAGMGSQFGQGKSAGEAIGNPTLQMLKQIALQKAVGGPQNPAAQSQGQGKDIWDQLEDAKPTPKGTPGPDSITRTAEGISLKIPSKKNLNTYGTSVPPESMPVPNSAGGVSDQSPFWAALLGQTGYDRY